MKWMRGCFYFSGLFMLSLPVFAQNTVVQSTSTGMAFSAFHIIKLLLAFFGILCLILLSAYALKKFSMVSWTQGPIKLLTGLSLSTKERIILIDVGGKQMLLGVSPAGIANLHSFDEPVVATQIEVTKPTLFQAIYNKSKQDGAQQ